ncbi:MAG: metallophosphoesterase [Chitinophagales bacterium]
MKYLLLFIGLFFFCTTKSHAQKFAVIGDYGVGDEQEEKVADLVKSWNPDFILTVGDNNYPNGTASTIDDNIGKYYSDFIAPYQGAYGEGASENKFFPVAGNHDYYTEGAAPFYDYFQLPNNERYYDFVKGDVHFFGLNSNFQEPDGITSTSLQAQWLQEKLTQSTAKWKIVYLHHPPYSSGSHGSTHDLQWDFAEWGATAVIAGHDHHYERSHVDGVLYFVNGTGGRYLYNFGAPNPETQIRYRQHGAMLIEANKKYIRFQFRSPKNIPLDDYRLFYEPNNNLPVNNNILVNLHETPHKPTTVSIFPNPLTEGNSLSIKFEGKRINGFFRAKLFNFWGKQISEHSFALANSNTYSFPISALPTGAYFLELQGETYQGKLKFLIAP